MRAHSRRLGVGRRSVRVCLVEAGLVDAEPSDPQMASEVAGGETELLSAQGLRGSRRTTVHIAPRPRFRGPAVHVLQPRAHREHRRQPGPRELVDGLGSGAGQHLQHQVHRVRTSTTDSARTGSRCESSTSVDQSCLVRNPGSTALASGPSVSIRASSARTRQSAPTTSTCRLAIDLRIQLRGGVRHARGSQGRLHKLSSRAAKATQLNRRGKNAQRQG